MTNESARPTLYNLVTDKPFVAWLVHFLPSGLVCGALMAIVQGKAGWEGRGIVALPGIPGLVCGILYGLTVGLAVQTYLWLGILALKSKTKSALVLSAGLGVILAQGWCLEGWEGVTNTLIAMLKLTGVLATLVVVFCVVRWFRPRQPENHSRGSA